MNPLSSMVSLRTVSTSTLVKDEGALKFVLYALCRTR